MLMVTVGRINPLAYSYANQYRHVLVDGRRSRGRRLSLVAVAVAAAGGCALSILPSHSSQLRTYHHNNNNPSNEPLPSRLLDVLPSDLDVLGNESVMGAVGAQILLFAGWTKSSTEWTRSSRQTLTVQERLQRITPTWKTGGTVDYSYQHSDDTSTKTNSGIFGDEALPTAGTTVVQLAETLVKMGFSMALDLEDAPSRQALHAMLSWNFPNKNDEDAAGDSLSLNDNSDDMVLFIFSFDATPFCYSVQDCPLPGPSNELLAATAHRFVQSHRQNHPFQKVHVIAQWEVAAALEQLTRQSTMAHVATQTIHATPVGTPGEFQNTATIFELMLCEWKKMITENDPSSSSTGTTQNPTPPIQNAILLAHPDHLRRVWWTAQTILYQQQEQQRQQPSLRSKHTSNCAPPIHTRLFLQPAMQPYDLTWPQKSAARHVNLFDHVPTRVHTNGQTVMTHWYDDQYLGFFSDGDPQKWTHRRDVWILYDQWAIMKGIVTGTIDPELCLGGSREMI